MRAAFKYYLLLLQETVLDLKSFWGWVSFCLTLAIAAVASFKRGVDQFLSSRWLLIGLGLALLLRALWLNYHKYFSVASLLPIKNRIGAIAQLLQRANDLFTDRPQGGTEYSQWHSRYIIWFEDANKVAREISDEEHALFRAVSGPSHRTPGQPKYKHATDKLHDYDLEILDQYRNKLQDLLQRQMAYVASKSIPAA